MFLLPLAWGLSWRAVNGTGRGRYATCRACRRSHHRDALPHGVFRAAFDRRVRHRRLAWLASCASVVRRSFSVGPRWSLSWVVVPLLTGAAYFNLSEFNQNTFWLNSWGAPQVLGWLFTGQIFDSGRFPIVSLLVAFGTVVCVCRFRSDARARALLGLMALSLDPVQRASDLRIRPQPPARQQRSAAPSLPRWVFSSPA